MKNGFDINHIPAKLLCPISLEIMDKPVHVKKNPSAVFEQAWIEKILETKQENPLTRERLTKNDLVQHKELEAEIKLWMKYAHNETFCGLKPGFLN